MGLKNTKVSIGGHAYFITFIHKGGEFSLAVEELVPTEIDINF